MKYKHSGTGTFATTIASRQHPAYQARARMIAVPRRLDMHPKSKFHLSDEVKLFVNVLRSAFREQALLLFSSRGRLKPELLAIAVMALWPKKFRPTVVLYGEMYEPNHGIRFIFERWIMQRVDRVVSRYAVHSRAERSVFAGLWGIDPSKIRIAHVFYRPKSNDPGPAGPGSQHIFAGGNSLREYEPLLAAARQLPEYQFIISTTRLDGRQDLPPNVKIGTVKHDEFVHNMRTAAAVVVPLRKGLRRGAGMLTYMEAMWLKKPLIVSDALAVDEYVQDGETGLVVDGSPEGYVKALRWVLDPANAEQVAGMCERAHAAIREKFSLEQYTSQILAVMEEAMAQQPMPPRYIATGSGA